MGNFAKNLTLGKHVRPPLQVRTDKITFCTNSYNLVGNLSQTVSEIIPRYVFMFEIKKKSRC